LSCGNGTQLRTRQCNSPPPSNGGASCPGLSSESTSCNTQSCNSGKSTLTFLDITGNNKINFCHFFHGNIISGAVELIGGPAVGSGTLYARNPTTGIYGPVCDDNFALPDVCSPLLKTNPFQKDQLNFSILLLLLISGQCCV